MSGDFDFRLGAPVVGADGKDAGRLTSVLVEADGFDPKAIVVRDETSLVGRLVADEKYFMTDEVVIPIAAVRSATRDRVELSIPAADVRHQDAYLSYKLRPLTRGEALMQEIELLGGGLALPPADEVANKPAAQIEIDRDENVMLGTTGRRLGHVHDVLYDGGEAAGVVIRPEGLMKRDVVLPIRFISRGDDMALFADIRQDEFERLQPFEG